MARVQFHVYEAVIERVLLALAEARIMQFIDMKDLLETVSEDVLPVEAANELSRLTSLRSRVDSLLSTLKVHRRGGRAGELAIPELSTFLDAAESYLGGAEDLVASLEDRISTLQAGGMEPSQKKTELDRLRRELDEMGRQLGDKLLQFSEVLEAQERLSEAKSMMVKTKFVYIFEGWVAARRLEEAVETVKQASGGLFTVTYPDGLALLREDPKLHPPTLLRYPAITNVFAQYVAFTRSFGMPDYHEIDPTIFFIISFPVTFGLMFGDVGHGILLTLSGVALYVTKARLRLKAGGLLGYTFRGWALITMCGISSTLIGFLYGEFFGSEAWFAALTGLHGAPWFSPYKNPMRLLKYSIYLGVLVISFGILIDLFNKLLFRRYKEAFVGPLLWLWLYWSGSYLVLTRGWKVFGVLLEPVTMGLYVVLPFGVMFMVRTVLHGPAGLSDSLESLLSSFSHTVSFSRILALKMIGAAFSQILLPKSMLGIVIFVVGTLFFILILEAVLAFLHTLRLHWVEWFSKFYRGTGKPFMPFEISG